MQDFNQLSSLWHSQNQTPHLVSADEMLSAIKKHIIQNSRKNNTQIVILVGAVLLLNMFNFLFDFRLETRLGLFIISIGLLSVLFQLFQMHRLLSTIDYLQDTAGFISRIKVLQSKKLQLYQRYYWWYVLLLATGMGLFTFELSEMYKPSTLLIVIVCISLWIVICSVWVRKITVQKIKQDQQVLLNKINRFEQSN